MNGMHQERVDGRMNTFIAKIPSERSRDAVYADVRALVSGGFVTTSGATVAEATLPWRLCGEIVACLNTANIRRFSAPEAAQYAADMENNRWGTCYDPIIFLEDGTLNNGQTRCGAAYKARRDLTAIIIVNGAPDARLGTDGGRKRTITMTHQVPSHVASMLQVVIGLEKGRPSLATRGTILDRYIALRAPCDHYSSLMSNRKVLRDSHVAASFVFAETGRPRDEDIIRELADDLAIGKQSFQASRLIADHIVKRKQLGVTCSSQTDRHKEARMILRAIQAHLLNVELPQMVDHEGVVEWFKP